MVETVRTRGLRMLLAAMATFVVGAGIAWAAIPGSNGVINGCYGQSGLLRVIDSEASAACSSSETPISWSQQGPQGERGPQGDRGPQGERGLQGAQGVQGERGLPGERGPQGTQGLQGERGPTGPTGAQGPEGVPGVSGLETVEATEEVPAGGSASVHARCSAGKQVLGGGFSHGPLIEVLSSRPAFIFSVDSLIRTWNVRFVSQDASIRTVNVFAICAFTR